LEPQKRGVSVDISHTEHFVTAMGLIEISGSSVLVSINELLHCNTY